MVKYTAIVIFAVTVLAMLMLPAYASLVPMSWGFPTMSQNNSLSSMQNDFALATDFEMANVSFPTATDTFGTSGFGTGAFSAFPTMTQISNKSDLMTKFQMMNQQQSSTFAYPWVSIGFSPVPSMGFL